MPAAKPNRTFEDEVAYTLSEQRRFSLAGEIGRSVHSTTDNMLAYMTAKNKKPITVLMNTPGGSVIEGLGIYDSIKHHEKKVPINIVVQGACMSMGVIVLQAATKRFATPNSQFLLHEVSYGSHNSISGQEDEFIQASKLQAKLDKIIVDRSGIDIVELRKLIKRKDYSISAQEALEHNLIDAIY